MEVRCGIINNGMHTCDVEKTEIILGNTGSFELDKKIEPFGCFLYHLCDMGVSG